MGDYILTATDKLEYVCVIIYDKITWIPHITYRIYSRISRFAYRLTPLS